MEPLVQLPEFRAAVKTLYDEEFRPLAVRYAGSSAYGELLAGSECLNHVLWPDYYTLAGMGAAYPRGTSYQEVVSDAAKWMEDRIPYMDAKLQDWNS